MSHKRSRDDYNASHSSNTNNTPLGRPKSRKTEHNSSNGNSQKSSSQTSYPSKAAQLHAAHPPASSHPSIPSYSSSSPLSLRANLPTLPPLEPGPLSTAPFVHSSHIDGRYGASTTLTYERLEFLGDAYLEIIATRLIYSHFATLPTGRQAQLRERLIKNTTLAAFARGYKFGERVVVSHALPPDKYEKMLADVFEAYVAAVVLSWPERDDGFKRAETWMTELWTDALLEAEPEIAANRKDELVKLVGGKEVKIEYVDENPVEEKKRGAVQRFEMAVYLTGWGYERVKLGSAVGVGKKEAGMKAVLDAFENNKELIEEIVEKKRLAKEKREAEPEVTVRGK